MILDMLLYKTQYRCLHCNAQVAAPGGDAISQLNAAAFNGQVLSTYLQSSSAGAGFIVEAADRRSGHYAYLQVRLCVGQHHLCYNLRRPVR